MAAKTEIDTRFLSELPISTLHKIYIEFLFKDFLYRFKNFFSLKLNNRVLDKNNIKWRYFIVKLLDVLEPRFYNNTDEDMIQE